jgi:hypothetical protein
MLMNTNKPIAILLSALQLSWSISAGAPAVSAQTLAPGSRVQASAIRLVPGQAAAIESLMPLSPAQSLAPGLGALGSLGAASIARPSRTAHAPSPSARISAAAPGRSTARAALAKTGKALSLNALAADAPAESSRISAERTFAQLRGERLIAGSEDDLPVPPGSMSAGLSPASARLAPAAARLSPGNAEQASPAQAPQKPSFWRSQTFRQVVGLVMMVFLYATMRVFFNHAGELLAACDAIAAQLPGWIASGQAYLLSHPVDIAAAAGSIMLSSIGIPQIIHNARLGHKAIKDLSLGSNLIWLGAATMLSVVSIGKGSSIFWDAANVAGVVEVLTILGQINHDRRDSKTLKATMLAMLASAAPFPFIITQAFMPLSAWLGLAFAAAIGCCWMLSAPQMVRNYRIYADEHRAPQGVSPIYQILLAAGSILHLIAAISFGDSLWAANASIAIFSASIILGQLFLPRLTNFFVGPVVRGVDGLAGLLSRSLKKKQ